MRLYTTTETCGADRRVYEEDDARLLDETGELRGDCSLAYDGSGEDAIYAQALADAHDWNLSRWRRIVAERILAYLS